MAYAVRFDIPPGEKKEGGGGGIYFQIFAHYSNNKLMASPGEKRKRKEHGFSAICL
jgi:hypothetical protein